MIGTLVNTGTIVAGCILGCVLKKGIAEKYQQALFNAMGFAALMLGINAVVVHMAKSPYPVLFIISLALGSLFGSMADLDGRFHRLTSRFGSAGLGQGLSTAILLFCIGTLSILGPINSSLRGDHTYLFTNATLDFVTSIVLAATYGLGIMLAAPILFLWQGSIYLSASYLSPYLTDGLLTEISLVGGILIAASGLSILGIKDSKTLNMLPSLLIPPLWFALRPLLF